MTIPLHFLTRSEIFVTEHWHPERKKRSSSKPPSNRRATLPSAPQPPKGPTSKRRVPPSNIQFPEIPFEALDGLVPRASPLRLYRIEAACLTVRAGPCMCEGVESSVSRAGNGRSEVTAPPTLARRMEGRRSGGRGRDRRGCRRPREPLLPRWPRREGKGMAWHSTEGHVYIHILSAPVYTYTGWFRKLVPPTRGWKVKGGERGIKLLIIYV